MAFLCSGTCALLETCIFFKTRVAGALYCLWCFGSFSGNFSGIVEGIHPVL